MLGVELRGILPVVVLKERPVGVDPLVEPQNAIDDGLVHDHGLADARWQLGVEHGYRRIGQIGPMILDL